MGLPTIRLPRPTTCAEGPTPIPILVLIVAVFTLLARPTVAQPEFPGAPGEPSVNLRMYPLDTWSPRVGFGIGAGLVTHHLGRTNAQGLLTFAPAQHEQVATLAWASANPKRARQYVLVDGRGLHTNRDWFYGLGPDSPRRGRLSIGRSALQARIRGGQAFLDHRLVVQPYLGLSAHRVDHVPSMEGSPLTRRSQRHLQQLASADLGLLTPDQTGLRVGIQATYDTRPRQSAPAPGLLLEGGWSRYSDLSSSFVRFDQVDLGAYGHVPLWTNHRLMGRLRLTLTENRGRAAVPYYHRPTLGGGLVPGWARNRFVDSDRLVGSVLYRFPIGKYVGVLDLDGHLGLHVASVYEAFPSDAAFELSFEKSLDPGRSAVPLRPSASLGLHLGLPFREVPSLDLALGVSPEGITAVRFVFNRSIQALRRPHHQSIRHY